MRHKEIFLRKFPSDPLKSDDLIWQRGNAAFDDRFSGVRTKGNTLGKLTRKTLVFIYITPRTKSRKRSSYAISLLLYRINKLF